MPTTTTHFETRTSVPLVLPRARAHRGFRDLLARLTSTVARAVRNYRAARLLHDMPEHLLRDIGIARGDIESAVRHGRPWRDEANGFTETPAERRETPR